MVEGGSQRAVVRGGALRSRYGLGLIAFAAIALIRILADRSGRSRAETHALHAERLQAVAAALSADLSAADAARAVLREGIGALGAGRGVITVADASGESLSIVASHGYDQTGWERFERIPIDANYPVSEAMRVRMPVVIADTAELIARYPSLSVDIHAGGSALALPLLIEARAVGVLYYRFTEARTFGPEDHEYLMALGRLCAGALERARLHDLERRATERSNFLAAASTALAASLDIESTVKEVARLSVPAIADYSSVHLVEPDGSIRTLALAGPDDQLAAARRFLDMSPPGIQDAAGIGAVIREGQPLHVRTISDDDLRAGFQDPASLDAALALHALSHMTVPLTAGGRTIGALALTTTTNSGRIFEPEDLAFAHEIASRAALAVENAHLYSALVGREAQQASVARLGQLALTQNELQPLFDATVKELRSVLAIDFVKLLRLSPDGGHFDLVAGVGWRPGLVGSATISSGLESQAGYALEVGGPVIVDDLRAETRFHGPTFLLEHGVVSGMSAAIAGQNGPWGVLGLHTARRRHFTKDDVNFLVAVTNVLAGAIERRRRLDEEHQAQDINRAFIGVVSHELRTPITTILGGAKMLRGRELEGSVRASIAHDVEAEADRLYRLTEDLLVMTRLEHHDLEIGLEPVLVGRLAQQVIASERRRWPSVDVRLAIPAQLGPAMGEDSYVAQVLRNLLGNAVKYSPAHSTIEIEAEEGADEIVVRVLDQGPGIRGEDPGRLFSLFYRAPSTATQASGAGIGLFVTDQLVRAMGGRLWAKARDGGGSEFGFALRRYPVEDELPDNEPEGSSTGSGVTTPVR